MNGAWEQLDHDETSDRRIFSRDEEVKKGGTYSTHDFKVAKEFQVRAANGDVLLQASGSANGEYWCGVFMFFVKGSNGCKVRIEESDREKDEVLDVPDVPLPPERVWE